MFGQFQLAVTLGCASAPSVSFGDQQLSGRGGGVGCPYYNGAVKRAGDCDASWSPA